MIARPLPGTLVFDPAGRAVPSEGLPIAPWMARALRRGDLELVDSPQTLVVTDQISDSEELTDNADLVQSDS